ncbi:c-type cytochrome [Desertivirga xinjiangensis]|uniref:c-type cytochrome n=1 Tax=Desertivirga xinjiangensis TaxID=539206 RepID=UPI0021096F83|nr:cytochrome c [Pedobacter xinjiangensis]
MNIKIRNKLLVILACSTSLISIFQACQSQGDINYARYYTNGKKLYDTHCQNCHGAEGQGLAALIPPLTDTVYLTQHRDELACIVKHGLNGEIIINGQTFNEQMPANHQLTDIDIAAIVTYITNSFGNKQGLYDVTNAGTDLKNCRH